MLHFSISRHFSLKLSDLFCPLAYTVDSQASTSNRYVKMHGETEAVWLVADVRRRAHITSVVFNSGDLIFSAIFERDHGLCKTMV